MTTPTPTPAQVEAVAKAAYEAASLPANGTENGWEYVYKENKPKWRAVARAAITAYEAAKEKA